MRQASGIFGLEWNCGVSPGLRGMLLLFSWDMTGEMDCGPEENIP